MKGADMPELDFTHDPALRSWVPGADGHPDFPIQNLPFCVFTPPGGEPRGGIGIGDAVLDLGAVLEAGLLDPEAARAADASRATDLNELFSLGGKPRRALRTRLSQLLSSASSDISKVERCLVQTAECELHLPSRIGDYTDFYVGIHHATNIGKQFRPDNPLLPNYKYVPIGYHGRASSVCPSGVPIRRPTGQFKPSAEAPPVVGPAQRLDYELELGIWIGSGNALGEPISIENAADHIAGYCLLNDWSARDIQAWEYQPLGPFLSKNFATTLSPWVVTPEALLPFQAAQQKRPEGDPAPLPYLLDETDQASGAFDIELEVLLITPALKRKGLPPHRLALSNTRHMYWSPRQMIAHHTMGGCNLRSGDLFGSGTISAPDPDGFGSILEATQGGANPIRLASDEERRFLEDGDEIILRAHGKRPGYVPIGFGECRATILSAHPAD
jgi:fumarylacetoacetase